MHQPHEGFTLRRPVCSVETVKSRLTLRVAIELLSGHIEQLYQFICQHSLEPPSMGVEENGNLLKVLAHQRIPFTILCKELRANLAANDASSAAQAQSADRVHIDARAEGSPSGGISLPAFNEVSSTQLSQDPSVTAATWPRPSTVSPLGNWTNPEESIYNTSPRIAENCNQVELTDVSCQPFPGIEEQDVGAEIPGMNTTEPEHRHIFLESPKCIDPQDEQIHSDGLDKTETLVDQLSERMGSMQVGPGGHIRYYGPTSNFNLVSMPAQEAFTMYRTIRIDGQERLKHLGLDAEVPQDLDDHLINLYFTWQDPALHVVDRPIFEAARPYTVRCAAFDTRHHPSFVTFPRHLAEFFADRAKALIDIELDCPCVATVQAVAVLSSHEVGSKRDSRGWLDSGTAIRLAFGMGLHIDMSSYVARGYLSQAEADLRRDVFWSTYVIDHMWGVSPGSSSYGNLRIPIKDLQEKNAATVARLLKWKDDLPPTLHVDLDDTQTYYLPHVLLLHMQYHQCLIHAHRPYMSRTYVQPFPPQGPGPDHARMMCAESAHSIAKLLQLYEIRYSLRRINTQAVGIACSAALLLIFANITHYQKEKSDEIRKHLSACFRALEEFESSWESAKKTRDFLLVLQREWELRARSSAHAHARGDSSASGGATGTGPNLRKRTRSPDADNSYMEEQLNHMLSRQHQETRRRGGVGDLMGTSSIGPEIDWMDDNFLFSMSQYEFV
ncbi:hypothetical protein N0V83_004489 [Neocucurbitaria cava]|uniref:Xylanolytic transcriptional activator regulatory domain-containing protein n=1 Tax=Neocucurbitaria cava TaxID=798079 RepID=A0A9W8Y9K4_9PLEO|nr:hypothetical protein N0V83_004489 [Neocucurbitaria cava]